MYTIQLDQAKNFECSLKIQGASLKKSKINMIIEGDDFDIVKFHFSKVFFELGVLELSLK